MTCATKCEDIADACIKKLKEKIDKSSNSANNEYISLGYGEDIVFVPLEDSWTKIKPERANSYAVCNESLINYYIAYGYKRNQEVLSKGWYPLRRGRCGIPDTKLINDGYQPYIFIEADLNTGAGKIYKPGPNL